MRVCRGNPDEPLTAAPRSISLRRSGAHPPKAAAGRLFLEAPEGAAMTELRVTLLRFGEVARCSGQPSNSDTIMRSTIACSTILARQAQ